MRRAVPIFKPGDVPDYMLEVTTENVKCPYCLAPLEVEPSDDLEGYPLPEGEADVWCPACGKVFLLVYEYDPSFSGRKMEVDKL